MRNSVYHKYNFWLEKIHPKTLALKNQEAELLFRKTGVTFNVYGDKDGSERLIPFDIIPRILSKDQWSKISSGVIQRVKALNLFLDDIYHKQSIIKDGLIPASIIQHNQFRVEMVNMDLPNKVYSHISGIDIVRTGKDDFFVLEDNLRTPSGVSYMLDNRKMMMRLFPELFEDYSIAPVDQYCEILLKSLSEASNKKNPNIVLLTPGSLNSAYYEHSYLAQQMGIDLVEGSDLYVKKNKVFMKTTEGPKQVDVIYRRIDDDFIDPLVFNSNSLLGVPGLMSVYRNGGVILANAPGTGVADDKSTYEHVPKMIEYYLNEQPILKNVPTYHLSNKKDLDYVLSNLKELVVKEAEGSGGYGMLIGPSATKKELNDFTKKIKRNPAKYIAQPTLALSQSPSFINQNIEPRHVDLRPFVISGKDVKTVPGGLCRVALKKGSLVVNSSQGGGTKDTWILDN
ncbi:MAG: circularly permuted type 2 ATP-grasp protein [Methylophilaceae bacterium]|nr:circularly permuted type 2 ATP-grasp protein [Methylophilaceae bacterium]MBL6728447.1 circularly permuted type 2 ATP-grasp protein [Methylophilaceae bacterium]